MQRYAAVAAAAPQPSSSAADAAQVTTFSSHPSIQAFLSTRHALSLALGAVTAVGWALQPTSASLHPQE
jgi:hypothetical protein